jgi:hypothetical protein
VTLVLQVPPSAPTTDEDVDDIVGDLEALLGPDVAVARRLDVRDFCQLTPSGGVRWFYAARS